MENPVCPALLPLESYNDYSLSRWVVAPCNEEAYRWVMESPYHHASAFVWGGPGKTHLAHIYVHLTHGHVLTAQDACVSPREILAQKSSETIALLHVECFDPQWLFDAFNILTELHRPSLWLSDQKPLFWASTHPDLASRLKTLVLLPLFSPDDETVQKIFAKRLQDRGILLEPDLLSFLFQRIPRDRQSINAWVSKLDQASAEQNRTISKKLITELIDKEFA